MKHETVFVFFHTYKLALHKVRCVIIAQVTGYISVDTSLILSDTTFFLYSLLISVCGSVFIPFFFPGRQYIYMVLFTLPFFIAHYFIDNVQHFPMDPYVYVLCLLSSRVYLLLFYDSYFCSLTKQQIVNPLTKKETNIDENRQLRTKYGTKMNSIRKLKLNKL